MISFDYLTLKAFYEENKDFFKGARLQKIQQPTRRDFILTIRGAGETRKLYINISPQNYHLCFISDETTLKRNITIPKKPPMFCMLLRKHLEGFRITNVNLPNYERIFEIFFESYNELNEKIQLCLAIELMGKYSNIILYNNDTKIITGCAHNVGSEKSRERELMGTLPYIYPQKQNKTDILNFNGTVEYKYLNDMFLGFSKAFEKQLKKKKSTLEEIKDYIEFKKPISPAYNETEFSVYSELIDNPIAADSVNDMIDSYFSAQQEKILIRALRLKLKNIINPQIKKQTQLIEKLSSQLSKKDNAQKYKNYADLIMANLYNNEDYTKNITVQNWQTNENEEIPLDEKLTLKENAQKYYQLFSKSKNAVEKLESLKNESKEIKTYLESILYSITEGKTLSDLYEILSECEDAGYTNKNTDIIKPDKVKTEERIIDGFKVYIGKNNKQNDYIISKLASPNDIWFHTQNCPSSHVLLKITDKKEPDEETIYKCAKLTKDYSSAKGNTKAGVIYTRRKYLKKPPKSNLGYVTYRNEKEIVVQ